MINIVVVEDSNVVREFLVELLNADPDMRVVGTANNGAEALEAVQLYRPDVITMDIHMPKMNGLEATRRIMEQDPTPIVIVSGSEDPREVATTFDAVDAGALAVLPRPAGIGHPQHEDMRREFVQTVKSMAEVKVVRRWSRARRAAPVQQGEARLAEQQAQIRVVAIGASTGGPPVLQTILSALPRDFPVPILIVQHMSPGFMPGFVDWLALSSTLPLHIATHGERLSSGHVYLAPDGFQMKVLRDGRIALTRDKPVNGLQPSVSYLFQSVAEIFGADAVAGLLTGMGRDGAEELRLLKEKGAVTFAQDKDSSVVYGMPAEAIRLDAAMLVLPPEKMAGMLANLTTNCSIRKRDS